MNTTNPFPSGGEENKDSSHNNTNTNNNATENTVEQDEASSNPNPHTNTNGDSSDTAENALNSLPQFQNVASMLPEVVFSTRTPKHVLQGVEDAVQNLAVGVGLGTAALMASTTAGASEGGVWGALKGFGEGLLGFGGLTLLGGCMGASQLVSGVYHTPEAMTAVATGEKYWDSAEGKWVRVELSRALEDLPATDRDIQDAAREAFSEQLKESFAAADREGALGGSSADGGESYYAILGVEKTATEAEVKKAYLQKTLETHPDKNPNDPTAAARFMKVKEAYTVLHDPSTRATYDRGGTIDPQATEASSNFLEQLLGQEYLTPLVGRLWLTTVLDGERIYNKEQMKELRKRRRLRIAAQLLRYLDEPAGGLEEARTAFEDAVSTRCGCIVVRLVAEQYYTAARQQLRESVALRELDSFVSSRWDGVRRLYTTTVAGAGVMRGGETQQERDLVEFLGAVISWDAPRIVLQACRLVLFDCGVPVTERTRRANTLLKLHQIAVEVVEKEEQSRAAQQQLMVEEAEAAVPPTPQE